MSSKTCMFSYHGYYVLMHSSSSQSWLRLHMNIYWRLCNMSSASKWEAYWWCKNNSFVCVKHVIHTFHKWELIQSNRTIMVHFVDMWETFNPAFKMINRQVDIAMFLSKLLLSNTDGAAQTNKHYWECMLHIPLFPNVGFYQQKWMLHITLIITIFFVHKLDFVLKGEVFSPNR